MFTFMFQFEPSMRLSLSEVLSNPWFTNQNTPTSDAIRAHFNKVRMNVELRAQENLVQDIQRYNDQMKNQVTI